MEMVRLTAFGLAKLYMTAHCETKLRVRAAAISTINTAIQREYA